MSMNNQAYGGDLASSVLEMKLLSICIMRACRNPSISESLHWVYFRKDVESKAERWHVVLHSHMKPRVRNAPFASSFASTSHPSQPDWGESDMRPLRTPQIAVHLIIVSAYEIAVHLIIVSAHEVFLKHE
eukprot:CAMPEP_0202481198 /NCGR_PEP_ID=MMETSP1361-20130828/879_1 /ASSEMBLY_ACC=CAM_ASM_000849 /TAXON_ID=210615 /ORGANISM="Staurosira complex sp., Strain CCMP2646" /LENGTH=129 /DNA_ID=CAMNT_0049108695 /DNA_START=202 /DNA_END=591 /DNA_ORIENTATION=+